MARNDDIATPAARGQKTLLADEWRRLKNTDPHLFAMARRMNRWETGNEVEPTRVTEAEYDQAIEGLKGLSLG